jgi:hypothetical protein
MADLAEQTRLCGAAFAALFAVSLAVAALAGDQACAEDYNSQANGQAPGAAAPAQAPQPPVAPSPDQAYRPGFLHQLKVWWDDSVALFDIKNKDAHGGADDANKKPDDTVRAPVDAANDAAKGPATTTGNVMQNAVDATKGAAASATGAATDAMKGAMEATKNAATAIVRLPNTRFVELHETCARAPNGGADCAAAAANGCRAKGFSGGNPLDTRTAEKCDPKPPQQPGQMPGVRCASETVVIRAVCQ